MRLFSSIIFQTFYISGLTILFTIKFSISSLYCWISSLLCLSYIWI